MRVWDELWARRELQGQWQAEAEVGKGSMSPVGLTDQILSFPSLLQPTNSVSTEGCTRLSFDFLSESELLLMGTPRPATLFSPSAHIHPFQLAWLEGTCRKQEDDLPYSVKKPPGLSVTPTSVSQCLAPSATQQTKDGREIPALEILV